MCRKSFVARFAERTMIAANRNMFGSSSVKQVRSITRETSTRSMHTATQRPVQCVQCLTQEPIVRARLTLERGSYTKRFRQAMGIDASRRLSRTFSYIRVYSPTGKRAKGEGSLWTEDNKPKLPDIMRKRQENIKKRAREKHSRGTFSELPIQSKSS